MTTLQEPKFVYMGGKLRLWNEALLHIGCEAFTRGLSVFEGITGFWQPDGRFAMVMLRRHYERLRRSARLLHIPFLTTYEEYEGALDELIGALVEPGRNMWARTTLYVTEGHWGEGTAADLAVTAYHHDTPVSPPINLGVSTWQRSGDLSLPARIKTATNYQTGRLARIGSRAGVPGHGAAQSVGPGSGGNRVLRADGSGGYGVHASRDRRGVGGYHAGYR